MSEERQMYNNKGHYYEGAEEATIHVHTFLTMADGGQDHQHMVVGVTGMSRPFNGSHVHCIRVLTSYDPKGCAPHWHGVDITTGPALDTPNGEHTHYFKGETSFELNHAHCFASVTDTSPDEMKYEEHEDEEYTGVCKYGKRLKTD